VRPADSDCDVVRKGMLVFGSLKNDRQIMKRRCNQAAGVEPGGEAAVRLLVFGMVRDGVDGCSTCRSL